jgi:hypothetical protein
MKPAGTLARQRRADLVDRAREIAVDLGEVAQGAFAAGPDLL